MSLLMSMLCSASLQPAGPSLLCNIVFSPSQMLCDVCMCMCVCLCVCICLSSTPPPPPTLPLNSLTIIFSFIVKAYDIGRSQLDDDYRKSCNEVQNLRREYLQTLQVTTAAKKKLEQTISKQPVRPAEVDK